MAGWAVEFNLPYWWFVCFNYVYIQCLLDGLSPHYLSKKISGMVSLRVCRPGAAGDHRRVYHNLHSILKSSWPNQIVNVLSD